MSTNASELRPAASRFILLGVLALLVLGIMITSFVLATDIILILFLGVLFGIFLTKASQPLGNLCSLPYGLSVGIVTFLVLVFVFGSFLLFGVQIDNQIDKAAKKLDEGVAILRDKVDDYPTLKSTLQSTPFLQDLITNPKESSENKSSSGIQQNNQPESDSSPPEDSKEPTKTDTDGNPPKDSSSKNNNGKENSSEQQSDSSKAPRSLDGRSASQLLSGAKQTATGTLGVLGKIFSSTLGMIVNVLVVFFVGLFLAIEPKLYRDGVIKLFPRDKRERTGEIMDKMGDSMWAWTLGRFGSMAITGIGASIVLLILGVPMALSLGLVTGLLAFIPNIGGAIALMFSFLIALSQGFTTAFWLIPAYLLLQLIESYIATPLIQKKQVSIPPALLIAFQAITGILFGFIGAMVASPLLAATKVGIEEAYIKDILEADVGDNDDEDNGSSND